MEDNTLAFQQINLLIANIENVIKGKSNQIKLVLTALLSGGHVLLEDNPGTGKTILARTLAASISGVGDSDAVFKRIQFTPDLLPMDLTGSYIFDDQTKAFVFRKGPLFCNVLLADEINRASPKVQSALLECMAENQITMGEHTFKLERLFFTIATQNPIEMEGTYPLPAAQLDRFAIKLYFGYTDPDTELMIYRDYLGINNALQNVRQVVTLDSIIALKAAIEKVSIHDELLISVRNIVNGTRIHPDLSLGASTRSGIAFIKCLKAYAFINNRLFVNDDDLAQLTESVLDHRLVARSKVLKKNALNELLAKELDRLRRIQIA